MKKIPRQNHQGKPARRRRRALAVTVALVLPLMRVSRALGQAEDEAGYRKSYYQEDDNRIHVSTDTWQFDVGLKSNVRVSGEVVVDAISGATPVGAPPQSQWPFSSYANTYQAAYQQAYVSQYNSYISQNLIYVGLPGSFVPTFQSLTNQAAAYAVSAAPSIATNLANANYAQLTNSPNYHRTKVPLTPMHDHRNAFNIALPMTFDRITVTPSFAYSAESDYVSFAGALNLARTYNDKNTTVSTGWAHNQDSVRDDVGVWQRKMTDDVFLGLVQLCGPKAYFTVNASFSCEHGYLADPYRSCISSLYLQPIADDFFGFPEKRPRHRNSEILYASWTQFVTPLNGSYEASYRFFHDSYGVIANTAELDWHQKIGKHLVISPSFRYYVQSAADFYYTVVPGYYDSQSNTLPTYYSSDYRLSEMQTFATGIDVTWRIQKHLSLEFSYMRYEMSGLDGVTSQTAYPSANLFSFGARGWF